MKKISNSWIWVNMGFKCKIIWNYIGYQVLHALFSNMYGCIFAMWFCRFLFSLNPALQVLHWNDLCFNSKLLNLTFIYLIPGMGVHQSEWACELWEHRVFQTIFHSHHKHISSRHNEQWRSDRHVLSLICTPFHSLRRHSPLEAMTKTILEPWP